MPKPAEVTLPSDREVRVTRTFNAPRQLVWDAHTKPELVRKWQGYDGWDMPVCDMDVRVGGKYKWQWRSREDGKGFGFITPDAGGKDLFAHFSAIQGSGHKTLRENQKVTYEVTMGAKGEQATNIVTID